MQTHQIVRGSAEVLTITRLAVNDTYKRVVESTYSSEPTLRYGVVTDVMDNGPDAAVVALEFRPADFGSGTIVETKVITSNQSLSIFPARPDEVRDHMARVLDAARQAETTAREAWEKAAALVAKVEHVQRAVETGALTAPATSNEPLPVIVEDDGPAPGF